MRPGHHTAKKERKKERKTVGSVVSLFPRGESPFQVLEESHPVNVRRRSSIGGSEVLHHVLATLTATPVRQGSLHFAAASAIHPDRAT
jgi:hypothetical protein